MKRGEAMKDFPVFTTEYGVASLMLREIPYRADAYVVIQSSETPEKLLQECISFCRICGAERVFARGHAYLEKYPVHCTVLNMRGIARADEAQVRMLWPVTEENVGKWRALLNERMRGVDHAATLERSAEREILASNGAYFVHEEQKVIGAGWICDGELRLIAATERAAGQRVLHTLFSAGPEQELCLQVASTNDRAIRLYERNGFIKTWERYRWYRVF